MTYTAAARCRVLKGRPVLVVRRNDEWYLHDGRTKSISQDMGGRLIDDLPVYRIRDIYDPHFAIADRLRRGVNADLGVSTQVIWDAPKLDPDWTLPFHLLVVWPLSFIVYCVWAIAVFCIPGASDIGECITAARDKPRAGMNPWLETTHTAPPPTRQKDEWYGFISGA